MFKNTKKKLKHIKNFFVGLFCCYCYMYKTVNYCNKKMRHT